jgi:hypothetical protein
MTKSDINDLYISDDYHGPVYWITDEDLLMVKSVIRNLEGANTRMKPNERRQLANLLHYFIQELTNHQVITDDATKLEPAEENYKQ